MFCCIHETQAISKPHFRPRTFQWRQAISSKAAPTIGRAGYTMQMWLNVREGNALLRIELRLKLENLFRRLGDTPRRRGRYSRSSSRSRCSSRNSNYGTDNEVVEELSECFRDLVKEVKDLVRSSRDPSPTRQIDHSPRSIAHQPAPLQPQTIIHHVPQYQQNQLQAPPTVVQPIISPPIMPYHMGHHPLGPQVPAMAPPYNYSTYPGPSYHHAFQYTQAAPTGQILTKGFVVNRNKN